MAQNSTAQSLRSAVKSWRLGAVTLLSLSSGMPLGLVIICVPAWMAMIQVDIKTIGVLTLAQVPYAFKFLWSPLIDRFRPPWLGRKRGWILIGQLALAALTFGLASQATDPTVGAVAALTVLIAFASATQDIAIDAYTVDVLDREEQGLAVGARTAMYRIGMWLAGAIAISLGPQLGWEVTLGAQAVVYLLLLPVTVFAPEPRAQPLPPQSLREAIWDPFVGFLQKNRSLEIVAFLLLYKLADNLAVALVRPFLVEMGYSEWDVGIVSGTVGVLFTLLGTFLGSFLTNYLGVGRALWYFGVLQAAANIGYALVAQVGLNRPLMYAAMALDTGASGMGTGAFMVLLLRLTQKRFSATQYALFSSIFALGRTVAGPIAGSLVDAIGWRDFFLLTIAFSAPGLAMLQRFVPWGAREIPAEIEADGAPGERSGAPVGRLGLLARGLGGFVGGSLAGLLASAALAGLKGARDGGVFDLAAPLARLLRPGAVSDYIDAIGALAFGLVLGFGWAAHAAARRGVKAAPASGLEQG